MIANTSSNKASTTGMHIGLIRTRYVLRTEFLQIAALHLRCELLPRCVLLCVFTFATLRFAPRIWQAEFQGSPCSEIASLEFKVHKDAMHIPFEWFCACPPDDCAESAAGLAPPMLRVHVATMLGVQMCPRCPHCAESTTPCQDH